MNRSATRPFSWLLSCLFLAGTLAAAATVPARAATIEPPKGLAAPPQATPMPAFEMSGINGNKVRSTDLRDKVTVFRFWATW